MMKKFTFPYKNTKDPKYIKDKKDIFNISGNGWWWEPPEKKGRRPLARKPKR